MDTHPDPTRISRSTPDRAGQFAARLNGCVWAEWAFVLCLGAAVVSWGAPEANAASYARNGVRLTNFDFSFLYPPPTVAWEESWDAVVDARDPKNEKIIVPGIILNSPPRSYVLKYNTDLTPDTRFGPDGKGYSLLSWTDKDSPGNGFTIKGVAVREDGKILLAGSAPQKNSPGLTDIGVIQLTENGLEDTAFGETDAQGKKSGRVSFDFNGLADVATALAYDQKRKAIWVAGLTRGDRGRMMQPTALVAKLTADGALDPSFNGTGKLSVPGGAAADIAVDANGNAIFIGGRYCYRLTPAGTFDPTFGANKDGKALIGIGAAGLDLQPDGKIVFGGTSGGARDPGGAMSPAAMDSDFAAARLNPDGTPDATFGRNGVAIIPFNCNPAKGGVRDRGNDIQVRSDGKIVIGGMVFLEYMDLIDMHHLPSAYGLVVLNADGSPDTSFSDDGKEVINFTGYHPEANGADKGAGIAILPSDQSTVFVGFAMMGHPIQNSYGDVGVAIIPHSPSQVSFAMKDTIHSGGWKNLYGIDGYSMAGVTPRLPAYATVSYANAKPNVVKEARDWPNALQMPDSTTDRIAANYQDKTLSVVVTIKGNTPNPVALYFCDYDRSGRSATVQAFNPDTNTLIESQTVDDFQNGVYLQYHLKGRIRFQLTGKNDRGAVLPDVFFGYENSVSFAGKDATTSGNWKGIYGADGYLLAGYPSKLPAYVTARFMDYGDILEFQYSPWGKGAGPVTATSAFFTSSPGDNALQKPGSDEGRVGRAIASLHTPYSQCHSGILVDVAINDYSPRSVALYFADFKGAKLSMTVEALDGETEEVLNSQSLSEFPNGVYLKYRVKGHIKFRIKDNTAEDNGTVISGIFFDSA